MHLFWASSKNTMTASSKSVPEKVKIQLLKKIF